MDGFIFKPEDNIAEAESLKAMDDSHEYYMDVLKAFYRELLKTGQIINDSFDDKDYESYRVTVHGLKSSASSVGFNSLAEIARTSDSHLKKGETLEATKLHNDLYMNICDSIKLIGMRINEYEERIKNE